MKKKNKGRRKTISCGTLPWRIVDGKYEVLLIKQFDHNDSWGVPKGHIDVGESLEACAIRETREETGVLVKLCGRLPDIVTCNGPEDKTVITWLAQAIGNDTPTHDDPDSEVADAAWHPIGTLPRIHPYQRGLVAHAVATLASTSGLCVEGV